MQYLKQIVNAINTAIAANLTDERFAGAEYNGIAISAVNADNKLSPLVADNYDEEKWVGIDDTFPIRIYHKTIQISYQDVAVNSTGDAGNTVKKETAQMCAIVYGNRERIRMTPEELEGAIVAGLPSQIANTTTSRLNLRSCVIRPTGSLLSSVDVYLQEYRTAMYELPPNALLIRVNYNIESTYKTSCFNICDC